MKETLKSFAAMVLVGMLGGAVRYLRHCRNEKFDVMKFTVSIACSGLVGVIAYGLCDIFDLTAHAKAAVVAMSGYCGGSLLDAIHDGLIGSCDGFFKAIIERLTGRDG